MTDDFSNAPDNVVVWGHAGWGQPMFFPMKKTGGKWFRRVHEWYWAEVRPLMWGGRV